MAFAREALDKPLETATALTGELFFQQLGWSSAMSGFSEFSLGGSQSSPASFMAVSTMLMVFPISTPCAHNLAAALYKASCALAWRYRFSSCLCGRSTTRFIRFGTWDKPRIEIWLKTSWNFETGFTTSYLIFFHSAQQWDTLILGASNCFQVLTYWLRPRVHSGPDCRTTTGKTPGR